MRLLWANDINWKVHTKDKRIYLMRDHNWAFASWEIARLENRISDKAIVVHVDSHLDNAPDGALVKGVHDAKTRDEIIKVSESYDRATGVPESNIMHIDNFIWASVARGTIDEVIYVSRDRLDVVTLDDLRINHGVEQELILKNIPKNCNYRHHRYYSITEFLSSTSPESFAKYVDGRSAILDLDIDVFNKSDSNLEPDLVPLFEVREHTDKLMNLYNWDLITIAISPSYCGGNNEAEMILDNVLSVMKVKENEFVRW